jgi:hypothetical protein
MSYGSNGGAHVYSNRSSHDDGDPAGHSPGADAADWQYGPEAYEQQESLVIEFEQPS